MDRLRQLFTEHFGSPPESIAALQGDLGVLRAQPDDDVDVGVAFERLGHAAPPERPQAGDEHASTHPTRPQPNQTLRRSLSMS